MMARTNPFEFIQQVRAETAKVTWPTRNETIVTSIMVVIMAIITATFFFLADQVLSWGVGLLLGLGR
ncbi:MAG: preprotein translocase subunit SecE [Rhodomicrobiaceae bacterium]